MSSTTDNVVAASKHGQTTTSGCLLPFIEGKKRDVTNMKGVTNDFIPPDLLLSLKRFTGSEQLPPPKGGAALPSSKRNPTLPPTTKQVRMRFKMFLQLFTAVSLVTCLSKASR